MSLSSWRVFLSLRLTGNPLLNVTRCCPRGNEHSHIWNSAFMQKRCISLSFLKKGERSKNDQFYIDEETMNIISPGQNDADPRDVPMLHQDRPSVTTPPPPSATPTVQAGGTLPIVRMRLQDQWHQRLPIVHIKATYNNTIFSITDHTGKILAWTSSGSVGFKNARRGTTFAAQSAAMTAAQKVRQLGFQKVQVKIKGPGPGRQPSIKGLEGGGLQVVSIQDVTPVPHNGCRPRKARRL